MNTNAMTAKNEPVYSNAELEAFAKNLRSAIIDDLNGKAPRGAKKKTLEIIDAPPSAKRTKRLNRILRSVKAHFGVPDAKAIEPDQIKKFLEKIIAIIQAILPLLALFGL